MRWASSISCTRVFLPKTHSLCGVSSDAFPVLRVWCVKHNRCDGDHQQQRGPDGYSSSVTTNGASPVPSTPGQTPAPGTYNMVTVTSDCNGQSSTQYSYVPGMRGVSRVVNSNCG